MKRFWKQVSVELEDGGWGVRLDGRPVKTPARAPLLVPTDALARAIADEWRSVGETIDPRAMPLTGLANAAIDRIAPERQSFAEGLARYAEADLACYRAEGPRGLVEAQEQHWDTLLDWARRRFDVNFRTTTGLRHVTQPDSTIEQLSHSVQALDAAHLAGLSLMVPLGGSLIAALAVLEKAITAEQAWEAVSVDEHWQLHNWGADAEAEAALESRRRDFLAGARFLDLLA